MSIKEYAKGKDLSGFDFFLIYCIGKNNIVPFIVLCRVFEAAFSSSLLIGHESLVGADTESAIKLYGWV